MALIVTHLQDKKSVYLQDKDGNEVEFIRADNLRKLRDKLRKEGRSFFSGAAGLGKLQAANEIDKLLEVGDGK